MQVSYVVPCTASRACGKIPSCWAIGAKAPSLVARLSLVEFAEPHVIIVGMFWERTPHIGESS